MSLNDTTVAERRRSNEQNTLLWALVLYALALLLLWGPSLLPRLGVSRALGLALSHHLPPLVLLAAAVWYFTRYPSFQVVFRRPAGTIWWIIGGAAAGAAGALVSPPSSLEALAPALPPGVRLVWALVWVGMVAPLVEEFFMRGALQTAFERNMNVGLAVFLSALGFALLHLNPAKIPLMFLGGLVYALFRLFGKSVWPAVAAHLGWNIFITVQAIYPPVTGLRIPLLAVAVICIVVAIFASRGAEAQSPSQDTANESSTTAADSQSDSSGFPSRR